MFDFSHILFVEGIGHLRVVFNFIECPQKNEYHIIITLPGESEHHITMMSRFGRWKIQGAPMPPEWIMNLETRLGELIAYYNKQRNN